MAAGNGSLKVPPKMIEDDYEMWKKKVKIWDQLTDIPKEKRAAALVMILEGKYEIVGLDMEITEMNRDKGVENLLKLLDEKFAKDATDNEYEKFKKFEQIRRKADQSITDYIVEFEKCYKGVKGSGQDVADRVLAFKLLYTANISEADQKMVLTICKDNKYEDMKSALKRIVLTKDSLTDGRDERPLYTESRFNSNRGNYPTRYNRGNFQFNRYNYNRGYQNSQFNGNRQRTPWGQYQRRGNNRMNPQDRYGNPTKCSNCGSIYHYSRDCTRYKSNSSYYTESEELYPDEYNEPELPETQCEENRPNDLEDLFEQVNITLFVEKHVSNQQNQNQIFVTESLGHAIIDTGCTKTVCGRFWYDHYINSIGYQNIQEYPSKTNFKFGDNKAAQACFAADIPIELGYKKCKLRTEVVEGDIPLLMSNKSMTDAGTVINLKDNKITMLEQDLPLIKTSNGHSCIQISPVELERVMKSDDNTANKHLEQKEVEFGNLKEAMEESITLQVRNMDSKDEKETLIKLHKQFAHASYNKLERLLKSANKVSDNTLKILKEITESCETCKLYRRTPSAPKISLPRSSGFNNWIALDLHQLSPGKYYLHTIDEFSRYSMACILHSKEPEDVIDALSQYWIAYFGCPDKIFSDNGGEFTADKMKQWAECFNIELLTTPAYSPFSNGIVERHNGVLTLMLEKLRREYPNTKLSTLLSWACAAKNALSNNQGFSPNQVVFGFNTYNIPNNLTDRPPALTATLNDKGNIQKHLQALHTAREAYIEAENSERIRRALSYPLRRGKLYTFKHGEKVYYKRSDEKQWKGPATVIGQDSVLVFIRHGGSAYRVHQSKIMPVEDKQDQAQSEPENKRENSKDGEEISTRCERIEDEEKAWTHSPIIQGTNTEETLNNGKRIDNQLFRENVFSNAESRIIPDQNSTSDNLTEPVQNEEIEESGCDGTDTPALGNEMRTNEAENNTSRDDSSSNLTSINVDLVKIGDHITFKTTEGHCTAKVLSRASKQNCLYKDWFNIQETNPTKKAYSIDLSKVMELKKTICNINTEPRHNPEYSRMVEEAKQKELKVWLDNNVYDCIEKEETHLNNSISTRWVLEHVTKDDHPTIKARLVARGYEEEKANLQIKSPTAKCASLKLVLTIIAAKGWDPSSIDITRAFLKGKPIDREVFLIPPKEAKDKDKLWKLRKCVYGLSDAGRLWYVSLKEKLLSLNTKISRFYWQINEKLEGIIAIHVDDFIYGGTPKFLNEVIEGIKAIFPVSSEKHCGFTYLGIEFQKHQDGAVSLSQKKYIEQLQPIQLSAKRQAQRNNEANSDEYKKYRSLCGQLNWLSTRTRPDLAFDTCILSNRLKDTSVNDLKIMNKVIKKVKGNSGTKLVYRPLKDIEQAELVTFSDASYGKLSDGGSQGGYIIFLRANTNSMNVISWKSVRLNRVCRSPEAAEALALMEAASTCVVLAACISELFSRKTPIKTTCYVDSISLVDVLKSKKDPRESRLLVDIVALREMILQNEITVEWVSGKEMIADALTKTGCKSDQILSSIA